MVFPQRIRAGMAAVAHDLRLQNLDVESDGSHADAAMDWLMRSQNVTQSEGSAASYNLLLGWQRAYPETSGYLIPTMYSYAEVKNAPAVANRAVRIADWLVTIQHTDGSFPAGTGETGPPSVFNSAQIILGLSRAYRETQDDGYMVAIEEAADWLVAVQEPNGSWEQYDYLDHAHAYSSRIGWALLEAAALLPGKRKTYRDAARRNLFWVLGLQTSTDWFERSGFSANGRAYLHTIAYTIRGLLEGGFILDNLEFIEAATATADRLLDIQRSDGNLRGRYNSNWGSSWFYCLTGNAQIAIVWLRLHQYTGNRVYKDAAEEAIEFLKRRQQLHGPSSIQGGLAGSYPLWAPYMYLRYPNWASKFFTDALLLNIQPSLDIYPHF